MKHALKNLMSKFVARPQKADARISSLDENMRQDLVIARELAQQSFS